MAADGQLIETDAHLCRCWLRCGPTRQQRTIDRRRQLYRFEIAEGVAAVLAGRHQRVFDGRFEAFLALAGALLGGVVHRELGALDHPAAADFLRRQAPLFDHVHHLPACFSQ